MKRNKAAQCVFITFITVFFMLTFAGCSKEESYEAEQSFERYFYPEEYEEEFSKIEEIITLSSDMDYCIEISSICEAGTLSIESVYNDQQNTYEVSEKSPCSQQIEIAKNTTKEITFTIQIQPDTNGYVKVNVLSK